MAVISRAGPLPAKFARRVFIVGLVVVIGQLFVGDGVGRALYSFLINITAATAMAFGITRNRPNRPLAWWFGVGAMVLFAVSNLGWAAEFADFAPGAATLVVDTSKLVATLLIAAAIAVFISRRETDRSAEFFIDTSLIVAGLALMIWQWALLTDATQSYPLTSRTVVPLVIAGLLVVLSFTAVRLFGRPRLGTVATMALIGAIGLGLIAQSVLSLAAPDAPPRWSDLLWLTPAVLVAVAALFPPRVDAHFASVTNRAAPRLILAGALLLANPILVWLHLLREVVNRELILTLAGMVGVLTLAGLWRLGRLMIDLDEAQDAVRMSEMRFRSLVQQASDVITVLDAEGLVSYASPSASRVLGYDPRVLSGQQLRELVHEDDVAGFDEFLALCADRPGAERSTSDVRMRNSTGRFRATQIVAVNLMDQPEIQGMVVTIRDITDRIAFETQLRHLASHDALTGLANRVLFADRVMHALTRSARQQTMLAVVFVDLDDFKTINDSLGHLAGDEVLRVVAGRLEDSLRATDTAARLGGDEFAVLLEDLHGSDDALITVERILSALRAPIMLDNRPVTVSAALGIAFSSSGSSAEELLRNADTAMFRAKAAGKGRYELFEQEMHAAARSRFDLKSDLEDALARDEFLLHYQPIYYLESRRIAGLEALLRWQHPTRGLVMPDSFIPLLEETGHIVPVGRWVLTEAARMGGLWQQHRADSERVAISVNLSVRQFRQPDLVDDVSAALSESGLDAHELIIEITESVFLSDTDAALLQIERLRELGVRLAIDDFGTGYSALSYLQKFRADIVKVDKTFVATLDADEGERALTQGIVTLAKTLGIRTVAEGVERHAQVEDLSEMDCPFAQGFYFTEPLPAHQIGALLEAEAFELENVEGLRPTGSLSRYQ